MARTLIAYLSVHNLFAATDDFMNKHTLIFLFSHWKIFIFVHTVSSRIFLFSNFNKTYRNETTARKTWYCIKYWWWQLVYNLYAKCIFHFMCFWRYETESLFHIRTIYSNTFNTKACGLLCVLVWYVQSLSISLFYQHNVCY